MKERIKNAIAWLIAWFIFIRYSEQAQLKLCRDIIKFCLGFSIIIYIVLTFANFILRMYFL